jgi:hypothetical protein
LLEASKENLTLDDTAVGRAKQRKKIEFQQAIRTMTRDEWTDAASVWDSVESTCNSTADGMADGVSDEP